MDRPKRPTRDNNETEYVRLSESFDFESDMKIDPDFLDAEIVNHPETFMRYAKASSLANSRLRLAEEKVKTIRSMVIKKSKEDNPKHTETTLEAAYRLDPDYLQAKQEQIEAAYDADLFSNAMFALQAKKTAYENLVRLMGQEYFSTPQIPHELPEAVKKFKDMKEGRIEKEIISRTNRRSR